MPTASPTSIPTHHPSESNKQQSPPKRSKKIIMKKSRDIPVYDDEAFLEKTIAAKQMHSGTLKIHLVDPGLFIHDFEHQLMTQHPNDYAVITKALFNDSNPQIKEYYGATQSVLEQTKLLIVIFCSEWKFNNL